MIPGQNVSLLLGWCQHLLQLFADVRYVWGPVQFTINDDTQKFGCSHFHNFISINKYTIYEPRYTFWCKKHEICFVNV